jgi:DNA-directed RNA polymerase specialized sigma24 family protein
MEDRMHAETVSSTPSSNLSVEVLYARDSDGCYPVHVLDDGYKLVTPAGEQSFTSKRQLLIAITGHPKARNWTFDRYFKLDEPAISVPTESLLDWFRPVAPVVTGGVPGARVRGSEDITISEATAASLAMKATAGLPEESLELGIDLVNRSHEVAKLLFKGFGPWMRSSGYDPQEVLQEVYLGLLVRNQGKCPWTPKKSSFGHYVHMVCNGVMSNFHRKQKRVRECEQTGIKGYDDNGDWGDRDVASTGIEAPPTAEEERCGILEASDDLLRFIPRDPTTHLVRQILPYLRDGYTRTEIAKELGVSRTLIAKAQEDLQTWAMKWYMQQGQMPLATP